MRKRHSNQRRQKRNILFSAAVVALGCIISAIYANHSLSDSQKYRVDLSELDFENQDSSNETAKDETETNTDMLASVNGNEMIDQFPIGDTVSNEAIRKAQRTSEYLQNQRIEASRQEENDSEKKSEQSFEQKLAENSEKESEEKSEEKSVQKSEQKSEQEDVALVDSNLEFHPEDKMSWPVVGDVILNYSMDSDVYFETLQQYKYNPAIYVGAKKGDHVSACAKGQVIEVGKDARIGQYVVMDLGNGYQVTYGQLENLQVKKGSMVSRSQVIADVAKTTKYFSIEGDHVYLEITKDGNPVNPFDFLE